MTPHKKLFTSYKPDDCDDVRMRKSGVSKICGIGDIHLETNIGCSFLLKDVRHVPDLRLSLISAEKLDDECYLNQFGSGRWKLTKGSLVVDKGRKMLYSIQDPCRTF